MRWSVVMIAAILWYQETIFNCNFCYNPVYMMEWIKADAYDTIAECKRVARAANAMQPQPPKKTDKVVISRKYVCWPGDVKP